MIQFFKEFVSPVVNNRIEHPDDIPGGTTIL
jgi:hypothetical protein